MTDARWKQRIEKIRPNHVDDQAMPRMGQPEEIAHVYLLLATDECPFLTGELIPVDGGIITTEMPLDMDPESIGSDKKGEEKN